MSSGAGGTAILQARTHKFMNGEGLIGNEAVLSSSKQFYRIHPVDYW